MKSVEDAFGRLECLARLVSAQLHVAPWHETPFEERKTLEESFDMLRMSMSDGRLPASSAELRLAAKFIEMWTTADRINASWRMESAVTLAWALGLRTDELRFDRQTVDQPFIDSVLLDGSMRARASMRSAAELEAMRERANEWWKRACHARPLYAELTKPDSTLSKKKNELLRSAVGDGLMLFGKPYPRLTWTEHSVAHSIASERHSVMTWLCDDVEWDALPLRD